MRPSQGLTESAEGLKAVKPRIEIKASLPPQLPFLQLSEQA